MHSEPIELVKSLVAELADEMDFPQLRKPSAESELFGSENGIDSLSLVRLVAQVERAAGSQCGREIILADSETLLRPSSPFRTVGSLAELLEERLAG